MASVTRSSCESVSWSKNGSRSNRPAIRSVSDKYEFNLTGFEQSRGSQYDVEPVCETMCPKISYAKRPLRPIRGSVWTLVEGAFINAVPGIIVQIVLIPLIILALQKANLMKYAD